TLGNWATQTILEKKVPITKVKGQAIQLDRFVVFPLLHPAAALHQGNLLGTLKEDFNKLKAYLDRQQAPTPVPPSSPPSAILPPPSQMDLFGA
ncbi:MAG: uracil-DNA glycosylase, partial [Nitrospira sp.]